MGLLNTFDMLEELLAQNQFELLPPNEEKKEIRLVYLMNDAVELSCIQRSKDDRIL